MFQYSKEKKYLIISIIAILLDGVITYFIPSYYHDINYLYPMLTVSLIPFLYNSSIKNYYKDIFILGIVYDLIYSSFFLFNSLIFLLLSKINIKFLKIMKNNLIAYLILVIIDIALYDLILFFMVSIRNHNFIINEYVYKISRSMLLNLIVSLIYYQVLKKKNYLSRNS